MATLTPGVLLKLLQSMNTDTKVVGEHRSAVLQVIGIVPALSGADGNGNSGIWPSPSGFYLQLSDSLNSTYVSLPSSDADSVLLNRPQLGQLVSLDRLLFSLPVPRASGLRPIPTGPHNRPPPFLGSPEPLVVVARSSQSFVIQPASPSHAGPPLMPVHNLDNETPANRPVFAPKENVATDPAPKRRFSSPAAAKLANRKEQRDPSPVPVKANSRPSSPVVKTGSRASSPVPSKCAVPSLVAAKEENRKTAREPAIVVPSRYRHPSPAGRKGAGSSPMGRRGSVSPGGRRLSVGGGEGGGKKKMGVVIAGMPRVSEALMGSVRSVRKSWEEPSSNSSESKEKGGSKSKVDQQAILRTQVAMSRRLSDAAREQSNNEEASPKQKQRLSNKSELPYVSEKQNHGTPKISIHDRKWTDGSVSFDNVSDNLAKLGKEAFQRRNVASVAAAEALEEALATESIIRSLSMFSDLCLSSKTGNPMPTINYFLSIYEDVEKWKTSAESIAASRCGNGPSDAPSIDRNKPASLWVEAALATDLEVLSLMDNITDNHHLRQRCSENLSVDPPRASLSKKQSYGNPAKVHAKVPTSSTTTWMRGHGVGETITFAKTLQREMQVWFLKFVEGALDVGFRLFSGEALEESRGASHKDNSKVAAVLSHLKRVNDWLDGIGRNPEEELLAEKIERLKRKIYGFVITHVGSAFNSSISLSKA